MSFLNILSLSCFFILLSCNGNVVKELENVPLKDEVGIERATGVELLYSDSSIVRVAIYAPTLLRYIAQDTPKQVFPDGVDANFYDENHVQTSKLIADYGEQFQKERKVYLRDNVKIWNTKNEMLETEELLWNEADEQISSTKYVKITTPSQVIEGYGFKSNLDFTDWEIYSVKGIIESKNVIAEPF